MYLKPFSKCLSILVLLLVVATCFSDAWAQVTRPLKQEGKQTLYQRIITVPGAALTDAIGDTSSTHGVAPFSTFYVYQRRSNGDADWLQLGSDNIGTIVGWLAADKAVDWNQTLTVAFQDPTKKNRSLLFGDRDSLKLLIDNGDASAYRNLREQAEKGIGVDSPVVAIQPDSYLDIRKNFYLIPILGHEDILMGGNRARLLHVATVPLQDTQAIINAYRTGIVFVIDTTVSMGPYIERTRAIMRRVYQSIVDAELSDRVSYGLVGFRDSTSAVAGLEYVTRTYVSLADGTSGEEFLSRAQQVRPATVSSQGFNEDAFGGIEQALQFSEWGDYFAKYIILITDAGPRPGNDPLSVTGASAESLRQLAHEKNVTIGVFHLKTPSGVSNHAYAEDQYRQLSAISGIGDFYYPVETGDLDSFEAGLNTLTLQLTAQVREAASGNVPKQVAIGEQSATELEALQQKVDRLGYALRMRYLKENNDQGVPALFDAWMVDRDFDVPDERALDVRVLLSRDQLSDLYDVLRQVLVTAEDGALAPQDFLDELKSLAASISRDPEAAKSATRAVGGQSLADLGYMREYLEGLPYQSEVMNLDLSIWGQWPAQRQFEFINQLDGKVAYYRALHDNVDLWVSLDGGPIDGGSVYPLLLEALP